MEHRQPADTAMRDIRIYHKTKDTDKVVALAGNPNVGKSTVFNRLTGMKQHTGNWPGKTVTNATGTYQGKDGKYIMIDLPGTYSLSSETAEEETARDFICFGDADAIIVVCDATCLERNMNLVLQTIEITDRVIVCVNLMDEAQKKRIAVDTDKLEKLLGVPVAPASAAKGRGIDALMARTAALIGRREGEPTLKTDYPEAVEKAIAILEPALKALPAGKLKTRWIALALLCGDKKLQDKLNGYFNGAPEKNGAIKKKKQEALLYLEAAGIRRDSMNDMLVSSLVAQAEALCAACVSYGKSDYHARDRRLDRILTGRATGFPIMIALLLGIFWLTIAGANYPSKLLFDGLFWVGDRLYGFLTWTGASEWLKNLIVLGIYRVLAWVVSVMLPPMAIFFPLFTLLEDLGYLPRVAFNLDKSFKRCSACGKQALTMCMGFGCNAAGVIGCRIIQSPRERLIAIITNSFVPCNGRFPTIIAIISMFFVGYAAGVFESFLSALILTAVILLGIVMTLLMSKLLSKTFLKGVPSSFTLELPPYRKPQIGKVIVRSVFDRTLFVLGRAAVVAAPAGLVIWLTANLSVGDASILSHAAGFLNPFATLIGLDGVILLAFILGFPANEIVIPIMIMAYMAEGHILEFESLEQLRTLLIANGWTWLTAVCTVLFSLMHWPCSTTCLTIQKETKKLRWTLLSFALPAAMGILFCFLVASVARLFGLV